MRSPSRKSAAAQRGADVNKAGSTDSVTDILNRKPEVAEAVARRPVQSNRAGSAHPQVEKIQRLQRPPEATNHYVADQRHVGALKCVGGRTVRGRAAAAADSEGGQVHGQRADGSLQPCGRRVVCDEAENQCCCRAASGAGLQPQRDEGIQLWAAGSATPCPHAEPDVEANDGNGGCARHVRDGSHNGAIGNDGDQKPAQQIEPAHGTAMQGCHVERVCRELEADLNTHQ